MYFSLFSYSAINPAAKYPIPNDQIKNELGENVALKRPPYTEPYQHIRSPYEAPSSMLKYPPAPGVPIMPPGLPQDLKYTPPAIDMKYKPPENLSKSQFSADILVKGYEGERRFVILILVSYDIFLLILSLFFCTNRESNERMPYGPPGKYPPPPPESAGVDTKPNVDALMSHLPPHTSAVPMLIGPSGLPAHPLPLSHLPPNHPSLVTSPQTATVPPNTSSSIQGTFNFHCTFYLFVSCP